MFSLAEREQQAQAAILAKEVKDYQQRRPAWRDEPAINKAILEVGFYGWQSLILIAATVLVSMLSLIIFRLNPVVALTTLLIGSIIEVVFLYLGYWDDKRLAKAITHHLSSQVVFNLDTIRDKTLKVKLYKALEYWSFINHIIGQHREGLLRDYLLTTTQEATRWLQMVYYLAQRIDKFRCNRIIQRDWQTLPEAIKNHEYKLSQETNPNIYYQLNRTIYDQQRQWQNLQKLQDCMAQASYQLDSTIASLGTIYSQLLLVTNTGMENSRLKRLQAGISEQVQRLEALAAAMDEVYRLQEKR